ncbi:MAG: hypothetical protein HY721_19730 [Planctomycetes bacterium]|nr:hypothetical protein [Planctomycetota bacterium]
MTRTVLVRALRFALAACSFAGAAVAAQEPERVSVKEDFSGKAPGKDWRISSEAWKVEGGALHGFTIDNIAVEGVKAGR